MRSATWAWRRADLHEPEQVAETAGAHAGEVGLVRVEDKVDQSDTIKFVHVCFLGERVSALRRAKCSTKKGSVTALFEPDASRSLESTSETKDYIVLNVIEHVCTKLVFYKYDAATGAGHRDRAS